MNNPLNTGPFRIASILPPPMPRLKIVDVGAMTLGEGTDPYSALTAATACDVYGFEPVAEELQKLRASAKPGHHYLPYMIGDGSKRTFYECNYSMTSSLFEPNTPLLAQFQNLEELVRVKKTYEVETRRLDDIPELQGTDFLKVDVQGAELVVFDGAAKVLDNALVVHTEVQFVQLYKDSPLFGEIDIHLRGKGFTLHRLSQAGRTFKPLIFRNDVNAALSQILWGDAVYVRDFMQFDRLAGPALLKLATILHENYRSFDLAAVALAAHDRQSRSGLHDRYLRKLAGIS
jgi:FkbM family methyltransferase